MSRRIPLDVPRLTLGFLLLALLLAILSAQNDEFYPVDDAYISFQYARNWAEGKGIVFNPGERVEGYSNFLWVALLAGFCTLELTPPLAARLINLVAAVALIWWTLGAGIGERRRLALSVNAGAALLFVLADHTPRNILYGLEAPFVAALFTGGLLALGSAQPWMGPVVLLLFSLSRPEGIVLASAICMAHLAQTWLKTSYRRLLRRRALSWVAGLYGPFTIYVVWKFIYYGQLLPNSIQAKRGSPFLDTLGPSLSYIRSFLSFYWPLLILALAAGFRFDHRKPLASGIAPATAVLGLIGINVTIAAGDPYVHSLRYLYPALPILIMCASQGLQASWNWKLVQPSPGYQVTRFAVRGTALALVAASLWLGGQLSTHLPKRVRADAAKLAHGWHLFWAQDVAPHLREELKSKNLSLYYAASWLQKNASPNDTCATAEFATLAYYSGVRVFDTFGLVHPGIADRPGPPGGKVRPEEFFELAPKYFSAKIEGSCLCGGIPSDARIMMDWRFRQWYDLVRLFPQGPLPLALFKRREEPAFEVDYDFSENFDYDRVRFTSATGEENKNPEIARQVTGNTSFARILTPGQFKEGIGRVLEARPHEGRDFSAAEAMREWQSNWRRLLYHHPLTNEAKPGIHYDLKIPDKALLSFGVGMDSRFWHPKYGDGVRFEIHVVDRERTEKVLFSAYIDPKNRPEDRGWKDFQVDLQPWARQQVELIFYTSPGPVNDRESDFGGWGQPQIRRHEITGIDPGMDGRQLRR